MIPISQLLQKAETAFPGMVSLKYSHPNLYLLCIVEDFAGLNEESRLERFAKQLALPAENSSSSNRCRQRHRVRKAVFVQLVRICPKAFADVIRSGQGAVALTNIYPRPTGLKLPQPFSLVLQRVIVASSSPTHQTTDADSVTVFARLYLFSS
jgi:hypothetical protein